MQVILNLLKSHLCKAQFTLGNCQQQTQSVFIFKGRVAFTTDQTSGWIVSISSFFFVEFISHAYLLWDKEEIAFSDKYTQQMKVQVHLNKLECRGKVQ